MPRALMRHFMAGAVAGCLFLVALLALDIGGLRTLLLHDRSVFVPFFMLLVDLCALFGMAVMISSLAGEEPLRPEGKRVPIRVIASPAAPRPQSPNR